MASIHISYSCSTPSSSSYHGRHHHAFLFPSFPCFQIPHFSSSLAPWKKKTGLLHHFRPTHVPFPPPRGPHRAMVSLHEDTTPRTSPNLPAATHAMAEQKPGSAPKNSIWINPNSPRASRLRRQSSESRYARLAQLAQSLDSCEPTGADVTKALAVLGEQPSDQDAVFVLNNMENAETAVLSLRWFQEKIRVKKDVILYNVTLKVTRKCRNWDRAESLLKEMLERGVSPDNVTFSTVISCARLCNLLEKAVRWFERMQEFGCKPDAVTYSAMIDAYGRSGNVDMALKLYDQARAEKRRLDPVTFSTVIKVYSFSNNFDGALNVYEEMKALGAKPNLITYNTLLDAMGRASRPWQAKTIYREMESNGVLPNRATYAALIHAYSKARYPEDALRVYRTMKENGMELTVILYNTLLAMCADLGLVDEAVEIFEEMKRSRGDCKPDSWTFSSLITIYSCSGQVSEAEDILNEMLDAGLEPNIFVLTSLIQCYGKANQVDNVVGTFNRMLELGITPDDRFYCCLLNVMTQNPKEELEKVIGCVDRANPVLGSLVKQLVDEKVADEAIKTEAEELLRNISKKVKKTYCNCLIDLCVNLNMMERACVLLDVALRLEIYSALQSKSSTQWSLHVRTLSLGAALTALHIWMDDLFRALENGEDLPPLLGINTGHGKHRYSDKGLAAVFESHLRELHAPFHEAPDKVGWFLTTKVAAKPWLESRNPPKLVAV